MNTQPISLRETLLCTLQCISHVTLVSLFPTMLSLLHPRGTPPFQSEGEDERSPQYVPQILPPSTMRQSSAKQNVILQPLRAHAASHPGPVASNRSFSRFSCRVRYIRRGTSVVSFSSDQTPQTYKPKKNRERKSRREKQSHRTHLYQKERKEKKTRLYNVRQQ